MMVGTAPAGAEAKVPLPGAKRPHRDPGSQDTVPRMTNTSIQSVVVGIDGSRAALEAALWAVDEAVDRDVPLRLVHVTGEARPSSAPYEAHDLEIEYGETSLRAASSALAATDKTAKVEAEILWGSVDDALIAESQSASMLCVGSVGIGWAARHVLGSTAVAVSENAHCPVVVVRYAPETWSNKSTHWVAVGIDDRLDNDRLVTHALDEAKLRNAPVLAVGTWSSELGDLSYDQLENRVATWRQRYPGLHIRPVAAGGGLPGFLVSHRDDVQLAVMSAADADQMPQIIGPRGRPLAPHAQC
jgi:nucleotide-binding universal stress UspA family protein